MRQSTLTVVCREMRGIYRHSLPLRCYGRRRTERFIRRRPQADTSPADDPERPEPRTSLACPVTQIRPCEHHSLALSHNSDSANITRLPCHTIPTLRASFAYPVIRIIRLPCHTQFRPCEHHSLALSQKSDLASITRLPCLTQFRPCEHHCSGAFLRSDCHVY